MLSALLILAVLTQAPEAAAPPAGITGAASPLLPGLCVKAGAEAGEGVLRCSGLVGTDVFLRGGASDRSVALGAPDGFFPAPPVPTALGRTLSWRILADRPLAGILRLRFPQAEGGEAAVMAIVKAGSPERPGCLVGAVEAVASQEATDAAAARLADARAAGFRCGVDAPFLDGRPSDFARAIVLPWLESQAP